MHKVWLIGTNVFRQLMRNRILAVTYLFALGLVGVSMFLSGLGQEAEVRLARDFGLLTVEWVGFFKVLLCHVVLLFEETELKTISILLVKPIERWQYLSGKILGSMLLLLLNQLSMVAVLMLMAKWQHMAGVVDRSFVISTAYLFVALSLFSVVTVFFSILASSVPACAMFSSTVFFLGHFTTNLVEWVQRMQSPFLEAGVRVLFYVLPNFSLFNFKDNLETVSQGLPAWPVLLWPLAYAGIYSAVMLFISIWMYEKKEY
jgi:Cu-processing system permease protein